MVFRYLDDCLSIALEAGKVKKNILSRTGVDIFLLKMLIFILIFIANLIMIERNERTPNAEVVEIVENNFDLA